jgi:hypothetical protein
MAAMALGAAAGTALLSDATVFTDSGGDLREAHATLLAPKHSEGTLALILLLPSTLNHADPAPWR